MLSVTPRIDSTWQRFAITILNERLSPSSCGIEKFVDLLGMRGAQHLVEDLAHVRRLGPEHVIEPLAGELAGRHA